MRIAVVGSGISGLSAAWLLARHHRVTLFEARRHLGGHTNTVDVTLGGVTAPVDTGFLVFNERTYPNLCALFRHLGIDWTASEMSFSVRLQQEGLEWAGTSLATLFAQKRNLVNLPFWNMVQDILRFNREAVASAAAGAPDESLQDFLERNRYGRPFRDWYLLPMAAAIWSCPTGEMLRFPARSFVHFFDNHGLLRIADRPKWLTVNGGGRSYVQRMAADLDDVRLEAPVLAVRRDAGGVEVVSGGGAERFDQVVLAAHSDQSLAMLADASDTEREVLGAVPYQRNRAVLHTDQRFLPRRRSAWSAWNYHAGAGAPEDRPVAVSYLINKLQPLPFDEPVIVTLNPEREPRPDRVLQRFEYAHPVFDRRSVAAQAQLPLIQGRNRTWFCGAWTGYGFHEDGLKSALAVAGKLGAAIPWQKARQAA